MSHLISHILVLVVTQGEIGRRKCSNYLCFQFNLISTKESESPRYHNINIRPEYLTTVGILTPQIDFQNQVIAETDANLLIVV